MTLPNSALRAELGTLLKLLQHSLLRLAEHIQDESGEAWLWQPPPRGGPAAPLPPDLSRQETLAGMAAALQNIKYENGQDPHESRIYPVSANQPAYFSLARGRGQ